LGETGLTVTVTVNGQGPYTATVSDTNWTLADNTITPALAVGTYNVTLTITDAAGNLGTDTTTNELTITEGVAWTPSRLGTLALWLDAKDTSTITLNGSTVSQWSDKSGNGRHASQAIADKRPSYGRSMNGITLVNFDGSNDNFNLPDNALPSGGQAYHFSVVMMIDTLKPGTGNGMIGGGNYGGSNIKKANAFRTQKENEGSGLVNYWWGCDRNTNLGNAIPTNTATMVATQWEASSSDSIYRDGSIVPSSVSCPTPTTSTRSGKDTGTTNNTIGTTNTGEYFDGPMAEIVVLSDALTTSDRESLEGYLAHKWGLTGNLPAGHPYKTTPPTVP
jgi:hypothetical protein